MPAARACSRGRPLRSRANSLFVANYRFVGVGVGVGTDYLTTTAPSPLQHYWSLCIEEQFYLFWPAILIATVLLGRRLRRRRAVLVAVLIALVLASCAIGVRLTDGNPPWGYFSLASRGWELAVGGRCLWPLQRWFGGRAALRRRSSSRVVTDHRRVA